MDVYGRPQTFLKTAGPGSFEVRQRPLKFSRKQGVSVYVCTRPRLSIHLAVFLAVKSPVRVGSRPLSL